MPNEDEIPSVEANIPDDFAATEAEAEVETAASQPEPEPELPKTVPISVLQEMRAERQRAMQESEQLRLQNLMLMQQVQQTQQRQAPAPPQRRQMTREELELKEILDPFITEQTEPLRQELQRKEQFIQQIQAERVATEAMQYLEAHVPDLRELAPDLQAWLNTQTPAYRDKVTSDPDFVIMACNSIRAMRATGNASISQSVQADLKSRSKSERGISTSRPSTSSTDFNAMSDEDFARFDRDLQNGNWKGKF